MARKSQTTQNIHQGKELQMLKQSGNNSQTVLQLTSLVQLESGLAEANQTVREANKRGQNSFGRAVVTFPRRASCSPAPDCCLYVVF